MGALACAGNPYDGHTLSDTFAQVSYLGHLSMCMLIRTIGVMIMKVIAVCMWISVVEVGQHEASGGG